MANLRKKTTTLPKVYFVQRGHFLHISVKYNGVESTRRSTGIKIEANERWNSKARSIQHNDQSTAKVREFEAELTRIFYIFSGRGQNTNAHLLLDYITGQTEFTQSIPNLLGCFDAFIEAERERLTSGLLKAVTFGRHGVRRKNTAEFLALKYKTLHLPLDQLQPIVGTQFRTFLRTQKKYGTETINKDMGFFKRVLDFAVMNGWTNRNVLSSDRAEPVERKIKALTLSELRKMEALENLDPATEKVRWLFVFTCYTGLNHSDLEVLKAKDIGPDGKGNLILTQPRTKNNSERTVYLPKQAVDILEKYAAHCDKTGYLLPAALGKEANKYLKVIQAQMQFTRFDLVNGIGRKTYSSIMANLGVPLDMLKNATGHTNTQTLAKHYVLMKPETINEAVKTAWEKANGP